MEGFRTRDREMASNVDDRRRLYRVERLRKGGREREREREREYVCVCERERDREREG